jgi:hypothetical protein
MMEQAMAEALAKREQSRILSTLDPGTENFHFSSCFVARLCINKSFAKHQKLIS